MILHPIVSLILFARTGGAAKCSRSLLGSRRRRLRAPPDFGPLERSRLRPADGCCRSAAPGRSLRAVLSADRPSSTRTVELDVPCRGAMAHTSRQVAALPNAPLPPSPLPARPHDQTEL